MSARKGKGGLSVRLWTQRSDLEWQSSDGIVIEGSDGHWFATRDAFSLIESETPDGAMDTADDHWPVSLRKRHAWRPGHTSEGPQ